MAFAFALLESRHRPEECPSLAEIPFKAQREALAEMLAGVVDRPDAGSLNAP
jgi:CO dehydrogenase/acetyl-CoA synthase gamma subunit (corrinoid Fe-S protein)